MTPHPLRGEVWRVDLDPVRGHEQGRVRPALIVSNNIVNRGSAALVTIVPITSTDRRIPSFIEIQPPEGGLPHISFVIADQVRTISSLRLLKRYGVVSDQVLLVVEKRLRFLLAVR